MRMLFAGASAETADKQGRVTLPPMLREYAGLNRECVVIGAFNRVEIWDSEAWNTYSAEQEPAFADWSEEVLPGTGEF
jgi:MraZ protein